MNVFQPCVLFATICLGAINIEQNEVVLKVNNKYFSSFSHIAYSHTTMMQYSILCHMFKNVNLSYIVTVQGVGYSQELSRTGIMLEEQSVLVNKQMYLSLALNNS